MTFDNIRRHRGNRGNWRLAIGVCQPQHEAIIVHLRLRLNIPPSAHLLNCRHRPRSVDSPSERRVHHNAPISQIVAIRLHHYLFVRRHRTAGRELRTHMPDDLARGHAINGILLRQPFDQLWRIVRLVNMRTQAVRHLRAELAIPNAQVRWPPWILAAPKRHPRQRTGGRLCNYAIIVYVNRTPNLAPENEHVSDCRLVYKLLIELAHRSLPVGQHNPECSAINDCPRVCDGGHARAGQRT